MATKKEPAKTKKETAKTIEKPKTTTKSRIKRLSPVRTTVTDDNRKELVVTLPPLKTPSFLQGFVDFVRTQGVVGLAVGLVLGVAAKSVVDSLVANIFNPLIVLASGGGGSLEGHFVCLRYDAMNHCAVKFGWGNVVSSLISFLTVAGVVYFVVKGLKLDKLDKPKDK